MMHFLHSLNKLGRSEFILERVYHNCLFPPSKEATGVTPSNLPVRSCSRRLSLFSEYIHACAELINKSANDASIPKVDANSPRVGSQPSLICRTTLIIL